MLSTVESRFRLYCVDESLWHAEGNLNTKQKVDDVDKASVSWLVESLVALIWLYISLCHANYDENLFLFISIVTFKYYSNKCQAIYQQCYLCRSKSLSQSWNQPFVCLHLRDSQHRLRARSFNNKRNIIFTAVSCRLIGLIMTETSGGSLRIISTTFRVARLFN